MQYASRSTMLVTLVLAVSAVPIASVHAQSGSGKGVTLTMTVWSNWRGSPRLPSCRWESSQSAAAVR